MRDHAGVKGLKRAELAQRTGCNLETVRYYEKVGLLPEPPRTASGYRSYDSTHERRLRFVLRARELGFSLDEVRELLRLVDERDQPCAEASAVAAALIWPRTRVIDPAASFRLRLFLTNGFSTAHQARYFSVSSRKLPASSSHFTRV